MNSDIWYEKNLDLKKAYQDGDYDELIAYSQENQNNLIALQINNEIDIVRKALRVGSMLLRYFESGVKDDKKALAIIRLGALLGTIESFEKIVYEEYQEKMLHSFASETLGIKHLKEIVLALKQGGIMSHTDICHEIAVKESTLSEIMKKVLETGFVTFNRSGKYKLYSLTDLGVRYANFILKISDETIDYNVIVSQIEQVLESEDNDEREAMLLAIDQLFSKYGIYLEKSETRALCAGDNLQILQREGNTVRRSEYTINAVLLNNVVKGNNNHTIFAEEKKNMRTLKNYSNGKVYA